MFENVHAYVNIQTQIDNNGCIEVLLDQQKMAQIQRGNILHGEEALCKEKEKEYGQ